MHDQHFLKKRNRFVPYIEYRRIHFFALQHVEFNDKFEFQAGPTERFLNICLWCKPPLDCDVPDAGKKLILLGYVSEKKLNLFE
jgi:hypothetical protein